MCVYPKQEPSEMTNNFSETLSALFTTVSTVIMLALFTPAVIVVAFVCLSIRGAF